MDHQQRDLDPGRSGVTVGRGNLRGRPHDAGAIDVKTVGRRAQGQGRCGRAVLTPSMTIRNEPLAGPPGRRSDGRRSRP